MEGQRRLRPPEIRAAYRQVVIRVECRQVVVVFPQPAEESLPAVAGFRLQVAEFLPVEIHQQGEAHLSQPNSRTHRH